MFTPTLAHFLVVGAVLFAFGTYTVVTRTNAVGILMGVELILNAANVNFVAFNRFNPDAQMSGQIFSLFVIVLAAAEASVGLAIFVALFRAKMTVDVDKINLLKW